MKVVGQVGEVPGAPGGQGLLAFVEHEGVPPGGGTADHLAVLARPVVVRATVPSSPAFPGSGCPRLHCAR